MSSYPLSIILVLNLLAVVGFMGVVWLLSLLTKNASLADIFWGLGFVLIAWLSFSLSGGYSGRRILITLLTSVWGLRLFIHILWRNWGKAEDRRYQAWRAKRGASFWWISFFTVFLTQAVLLWLISLTVQIGQSSPIPSRFTGLDVLGSLVWLTGFTFEAVADWQLARFKADPANRGKVMDQGLWAYSRHPNYFGESLIWWGLCVIVLATPYGWWALISPIVITFLLLKVSGVTLLEKDIVERRPDYRKYLETTSAFIPWCPKRRPQ
jgi:steroid 5-alpha reductase family enzyme